MASMGLAWYQGQKNAQDAARGQIATMLDMAKNAAEADKQMEYFSPLQKDVRARQTKGTAEKLQRLQEIDELKNRMSTDPYGVTRELLNKKYGGDWIIAKTPAGIVARPAVPEGADLSTPEGRSLYANMRSISLGSTPEQMLSTVIGEYVNTTEESIADKMAKSNAQITKALEIEKENMKALGQEQAKAAYLYPHQERVAKLQGEYGVRQAATTGMYGNQGIQLGMGFKAHEILPTAKETAALAMGGKIGKGASGEEVLLLPKVDPKTGTKTLVDASNDAAALGQFGTLVNRLQVAGQTAPGRGLSPQEGMRNEAVQLSSELLKAQQQLDTRGLNLGGRFSQAMPGAIGTTPGDVVGGIPAVKQQQRNIELIEQAPYGYGMPGY